MGCPNTSFTASLAKTKPPAPDFFSSRMNYLLNTSNEKYPYPSYNIYQDTIICNYPVAEIKKIKFDYIFVNEGILKEVSDTGLIDVCGVRMIKLDKNNIVFESSGETFFDSNYSSQKDDHTLEALNYFSGIKKLGPKVFIFSVNSNE